MPHFSMSGNHQLNKKSQVVSPTARNGDAQAGTRVLSSWKRTCLSYQSIGTLTLLKEKVVERVIFFSPNSSEMGVCPYVQEFMSALLKHTNLKFILYTLKRLCITIHFRCTFHPSSTLTMMFDGVCE